MRERERGRVRNFIKCKIYTSRMRIKNSAKKKRKKRMWIKRGKKKKKKKRKRKRKKTIELVQD